MVRQSSSVVTAVAICLIVLIMHYVRVLFPRLMSGSTLAVCVPAMLDALVVLSRDEFEEIARQARYARAPVSYTSDSLLFLSLICHFCLSYSFKGFPPLLLQIPEKRTYLIFSQACPDTILDCVGSKGLRDSLALGLREFFNSS